MSATQAEVRAELKADNLLAAYDMARAAIDEGATDPDLRYLAVWALARMGSSKRALIEYDAQQVSALATMDALCLKGRILKDRARAGSTDRRAERFHMAADAYEQAYERFPNYFPAINAATTALLAGEPPRAEALARAVLADPEVVAGESYYALATGLEACILLGDGDCALGWLERLLASQRGDPEERASTATQLALLGSALPALGDVVATAREALGNPPVIAYSGHMFCEGDPEEAALAAKIDAELARLKPAAAFGALACGADIVIAEALIRVKTPLHVVLPFRRADFVEESVVNGGESWRARFEACMAAARTTTYVTDGAYVGDPEQFSFGTDVAHGLALIRARPNHAKAIQLAVLQPAAQRLTAGTARDAAHWASLNHGTALIDPGPIDRGVAKKAVTALDNRDRMCLLFADFKGFSALGEAQLPIFVTEIMGAAARVLDAHPGHVRAQNSWGDALYIVIDDPEIAAQIALEIQQVLKMLPARIAMGSHAGMRIAIHLGPVHRAHDPILGKQAYFGTEVTRTARIEPVTPVGEVYATLQFAAILALRAPDRFALDYVGRIKLAKDYGELAMFRVSQITGE